MNWRYLVPALVIAGLLLMLAIGLTLDPRKVPSPLIGKPAPAFALPRLHQPDQLITHQSQSGRVHIVNVWASWCAACRDEHEHITALAKNYQVPVIGLNYKDARADALAWLEQFGDPYTAIAVDATGRVGIDWGVYGLPETFVVDASGVIRYKHIGPITASDVQATILPLLTELRAGGGE